MIDLSTSQVLVTQLAVFLIAFIKGAFAGGIGLIGIPLMSTVMDPITAGAIMAPLFIPMDVIALWLFPPRTWSMPDLKVLIPAMIVGIALGYVAIALIDPRLFTLLIGIVSLAIAMKWYVGGQVVTKVGRSGWLAAISGVASGVTTMLAHTGGPPLAAYMLRLGLAKEVYIGTLTIYFAIGNLTKVWPWLALARPSREMWTLIAISVPTAVVGVWIGWLVNKRLDQRQMYQACYAVLVVASLKLLWDGVRGYL